MASYAVIARRYAKALFDIGQQQGTAVSLLDELQRFQQTTRDAPELLDVLSAAEFSPKSRKAVVDAIGALLGIGLITGNFLKLLIDKQRMPAVHEVVAALQRLIDASAGVITATVTTAQPLINSAVLSHIERVVGRLKGRRVRVESRVDTRLIAGVMVRVGDEVFDGSVATELRRMREQLLRL